MLFARARKDRVVKVEFSITYILSQIFTIITYAILALTYYTNDRKKILILSLLSIIANGIAYIFLKAWTGFTMCIVALFRNIIFLIDEIKNGQKKVNDKKDIIIFLFLCFISIIFSIFTYDGFFSLFSVYGTILYTFSIWQKKTSIYILLGIPVGILWIIYNIYIMSIFGIILETILLICPITSWNLLKQR